MDPHQIETKVGSGLRILIKVISWIRILIRIKVIGRIRIHINLQTTTKNVWNMILFKLPDLCAVYGTWD
jgi:hypothetical protein